MHHRILAWASTTEAIKSNVHRLFCFQTHMPPPIPAMPCTEAIDNKDNYIKQPFEIPLGGLQLQVGEMRER
ncbi:hypothetical protein PBY51_018604 [Eleginops maclovinus]|uniref:Uncharacterized protein n=1 Tax=Eleginops maclovinus TaxID=56733 RepID=A0AAN7Y7X6_ELEMC|nr:hypothetical protein PBY51_018604 [Eleginops maclovinus]